MCYKNNRVSALEKTRATSEWCLKRPTVVENAKRKSESESVFLAKTI